MVSSFHTAINWNKIIDEEWFLILPVFDRKTGAVQFVDFTVISRILTINPITGMYRLFEWCICDIWSSILINKRNIERERKKREQKIAEICFCLINYATNNGGLKFGLYLARINIWRSEPEPRSIWCWSRSVRVRQGGRVRPNAVV